MNVVGYYRRQRGMTQAELAQKLSLHRITIAKYECGNLRPGPETHKRLAEILGITESLLEQGECVKIRLSGVGQVIKKGGLIWLNLDVYNLPDHKRVPLNTDQV